MAVKSGGTIRMSLSATKVDNWSTSRGNSRSAVRFVISSDSSSRLDDRAKRRTLADDAQRLLRLDPGQADDRLLAGRNHQLHEAILELAARS